MGTVHPLTPAHLGSRRLRSVRPMTGAEIVSLNRDTEAAFVPTRALSQTEVAYLARELAPLRAKHELRRMREQRERLQRIVTVAALVVAWFCILFFAFQMGRGL